MGIPTTFGPPQHLLQLLTLTDPVCFLNQGEIYARLHISTAFRQVPVLTQCLDPVKPLRVLQRLGQRNLQ